MKSVFVRWIATLLWASLIWYLTTIPDFRPSSNSMISWLLSVGGHFFFFGIQAVLLSRSLPTSIYNLTSSFSLVILYGLSIELIQRGIPGRSFSLIDLGLDGLGAWLFLYTMRKYKP